MSTKTLLIAGIVVVVVIAAAAVVALGMGEEDQHVTEGVIYDGNGGKTSDGKTTFDVTSHEVMQNLFTKDGAQFESWNTKKDGSGDTYKPGSTIEYGSGKTVRLYAIWYDGKNLNINSSSFYNYFSLIYNGKTLNMMDSIKLPSAGSIIITVQPNETGGQPYVDGKVAQYKVIGDKSVRVYQINFTIEGDTAHTLSINNGIIEMKISYDGSKDVSLRYSEGVSAFSQGINYGGAGGKTASGDTSFVEVSNTISANKFTLDGKTFVSWNTQRDGSGTTYKPGDKVDYYGCLMLYAQWA